MSLDFNPLPFASLHPSPDLLKSTADIYPFTPVSRVKVAGQRQKNEITESTAAAVQQAAFAGMRPPYW